MTAEEALSNLIAALPMDFEDQGEIGVLSRAAETQDKLDWIRQSNAGVELHGDKDSDNIWAEN